MFLRRAALLAILLAPAFAGNGTASKVYLNEATPEEMASELVLTPEEAERISAYVEENGRITEYNELYEVEGLTEETINQLTEDVGVDLNEPDVCDSQDCGE